MRLPRVRYNPAVSCAIYAGNGINEKKYSQGLVAKIGPRRGLSVSLICRRKVLRQIWYFSTLAQLYFRAHYRDVKGDRLHQRAEEKRPTKWPGNIPLILADTPATATKLMDTILIASDSSPRSKLILALNVGKTLPSKKMRLLDCPPW